VSPPELSVVISTLGSYETLERVLDGYSRQTAPTGSFEIVLVVDAGEPDPVAVARAIGERAFPLRRIAGPEPGLSANRNAGRRAAEGRLVMFTDNDTIPVPRLVAEHLRAHENLPGEEWCVVGLVRWSREVDVDVFMRWLDMGTQFNYANMQRGEVPWGLFAGANVSMKRSFAERVGDFDQEHLPYGYEDTDWAYRAQSLGMRVHYEPRATVDHLRTMSYDFYRRRIRRVAASEYAFTQLHPEVPPWFHGVYSRAAAAPPVRGRGLKLARWVPRSVPWLGPRVWASVDMAFKQALAPHFLSAWDAVSAGAGGSRLDLSEWEATGPSPAP
jgi:GT2 family glycosyltransferase